MLVHQIINKFHSSNTYIIELSESEVVLIDVGNFNEIRNWLIKNNRKVHTVILTHEHSDHCHGINDLYKFNKFDFYCSEQCKININNSRQNLSLYIDELKEFEINIPNTTIIKDMSSLQVKKHSFTFIETPGHSPGSICILLDNSIFTGDTILNGIKTPLNLPHSNRLEYAKSIKKIKSILKSGMTIFPGHDDSFAFQSFDNLVINV